MLIYSCRQDNGFLVINRRYPDGRTRVRQTNGEFSIHPQPGLWWFVKCVGFETGGHGLDMSKIPDQNIQDSWYCEQLKLFSFSL